MMHGWGMGGFGMGLPFFGVIPLVLFAGGIVLLVRLFRRDGGSGRVGIGTHHGEARTDPGGRFASRERSSVQELFRLARRYRGVLTVSDIVSDLGLEPQDAEALLDEVADGTRVDIEVEQDGVVRYVFRELVR